MVNGKSAQVGDIKMIEKRCIQCGEMFEAKLERARFCSGSCRAAWSQNRPNVVLQELTKLEKQLEEIEAYLDTPDMWRESTKPELASIYQRFVNLTRSIRYVDGVKS